MSRKPTETSLARIQPLARLPVFFALEGRRVVIAGGSEAAVWKAELLAAAGARVELYAEHPSDELLTVLDSLANVRIELRRRPWSIDVMQGAALAILATESDAEAQAFRCAAQAYGIPCNVVDRPAFCDFSFGGIVNRSPLIYRFRGVARFGNGSRNWRSPTPMIFPMKPNATP